jgi:DNA-binding transcriptional regulator YdaS (Cro superfamily)
VTPIQQAIKHFGNQAALAAAIGVSQPTVSEWLRGDRPVPEDRAIVIEQKSDGAVTVEALCPNTTWERVPDPAWPNGKPLIDRTVRAVEFKAA